MGPISPALWRPNLLASARLRQSFRRDRLGQSRAVLSRLSLAQIPGPPTRLRFWNIRLPVDPRRLDHMDAAVRVEAVPESPFCLPVLLDADRSWVGVSRLALRRGRDCWSVGRRLVLCVRET